MRIVHELDGARVAVQVPSCAQQEPFGWTQRFGVQVPSIIQVPVHAEWVVTVQEPS